MASRPAPGPGPHRARGRRHRRGRRAARAPRAARRGRGTCPGTGHRPGSTWRRRHRGTRGTLRHAARAGGPADGEGVASAPGRRGGRLQRSAGGASGRARWARIIATTTSGSSRQVGSEKSLPLSERWPKRARNRSSPTPELGEVGPFGERGRAAIGQSARGGIGGQVARDGGQVVQGRGRAPGHPVTPSRPPGRQPTGSMPRGPELAWRARGRIRASRAERRCWRRPRAGRAP